VREFTPAHAARSAACAEADIVHRRALVRRARATARCPTLSLYCQGLNQSSSGTDKNTTLINLHLATGQIGKPGAGPFSLTGQPNAMGGREVGGLANLLPAHRDLANPAHRAEVARCGACRRACHARQERGGDVRGRGRRRDQGAVDRCTNPAQSLPDQATGARALERCRVRGAAGRLRHTATAPYADLLLPATTWGEKDGTVTNSERRISRVRAAVPPPGEARADWAIAVDVAQRLERAPSRRVPPRLSRRCSRTPAPSRSGTSTANHPRPRPGHHRPELRPRSTRRSSGPMPRGRHARARARLYTDGRFATADGKRRFVAPAWRPGRARDARLPHR
jgi:assimilatory nitrate reductase catalytic subunit